MARACGPGLLSAYLLPLQPSRLAFSSARESDCPDVERVLETRCTTCHFSDASFEVLPLDNYDDARRAAEVLPVLREKITGGTMGEYLESAEAQTILVAWIDAGATAGDWPSAKAVLDAHCTHCHNPEGVQGIVSLETHRSVALHGVNLVRGLADTVPFPRVAHHDRLDAHVLQRDIELLRLRDGDVVVVLAITSYLPHSATGMGTQTGSQPETAHHRSQQQRPEYTEARIVRDDPIRVQRMGRHSCPQGSVEHHDDVNAARARLSWHHRFRVASTSRAGCRSPGQLMRRGASKNLRVYPSSR